MGEETAEVERVRRAFAVLEGARAARTAPQESEAAVTAALALAPDDPAVRIGAYKFYFYEARLAEALPHADWVVAHAARALGLPPDWRTVAPGSAAFDTFEPAPRLFLQSLVAWAYCKARTGDLESGLEALAKVVDLDPADRFGAARLAEVVRRGGRDDD